MPTDDERRRMAERMRGGYDVVSDVHGRFWLNGTLFGMDITARSEEQIRDGLSRLAYLIDPDCEDGRYEGVRTARPVDREALLALADKMSRYASLRKRHGMDVDTMAVRAWVRRIREACGEVVG